MPEKAASEVQPGGRHGQAVVSVEHVGGIDRCEVTLSEGVTVLEGRNATNRTSFLTAVADVLGGAPATLKSDAEEAAIRLQLGDETYSREYVRENGKLRSTGAGYTDRSDVVDLFVRLLEDNEVRRAVERDGDLRDLLMRPVDTERIEHEVERLTGERDRIDERIDEIASERDRLPALEERRARLETELEETEEELRDLRERIDDHDRGAGEGDEGRTDELLDRLDERRQRLRALESRIEQQTERLAGLRDEHDEIKDRLADLHVPSEELDAVESEIDAVRREREAVEGTVHDLQRIVGFNEECLSGEGPFATGADDEVTDELDPTTRVVECWTCGSEIERREIEARLDEIRDLVEERRARRDELDGRLADLKAERRELRAELEERTELEDRLDDVEDEIALREEKRADLEEERTEVREEIGRIEAEVEDAEEVHREDLVETYQRLSELEYERGRLERELADVDERIDEIGDLAAEREDLAARREELSGEITALRSRIEDLERTVVAEFNDHMDAVLDSLAYENVSRVWIERTGGGPSGGAATFDLHIVRATGDDSVYEDTVDTLSESEREVIGLVVALAGYLAHEAYEVAPFVLLDSLEAIDSDRIAALVEYFATYAPFLLVALLPEDAAALPEEYARVPAARLGD